MGRVRRQRTDRRSILDRKSLGCPGDVGGGGRASIQCFAPGIFDCRITNETPTFGVIVRPDTSSWAAAAAVAVQLNSFVDLLLSGKGREGERRSAGRAGGHVEHDTS